MTPAEDPEVRALLRRRWRTSRVLLGTGLAMWLTAVGSGAWWVVDQHDLAAHGTRVTATVTGLDSYKGDAAAHVRYAFRDRSWTSRVSVTSRAAHPVGSPVELFVRSSSPDQARAVETEDETTGAWLLIVLCGPLGLLPVVFGAGAAVAWRRLRKVVLACGPWWDGTLQPTEENRVAVVTGQDGRAVTVATGGARLAVPVWDAAWKSKHVRIATTPDHSAGLVRLDRTYDPRWLRTVRFAASPHQAMASAPPQT